jgi:hypothetical protein
VHSYAEVDELRKFVQDKAKQRHRDQTGKSIEPVLERSSARYFADCAASQAISAAPSAPRYSA